MKRYNVDKDELLAEITTCRAKFLKAMKPLAKTIPNATKVPQGTATRTLNTERAKINYLSKTHAGRYVSPKLAEMFMTLADRYSKANKYRGYSWREDMCMEAVVMMCQNFWKFDPEKFKTIKLKTPINGKTKVVAKPEPFSYFTSMATNCFNSYLDAQTKQRKIKDALLEHAGKDPSYTRQRELDTGKPRIQFDDHVPLDDVEIKDMCKTEQQKTAEKTRLISRQKAYRKQAGKRKAADKQLAKDLQKIKKLEDYKASMKSKDKAPILRA